MTDAESPAPSTGSAAGSPGGRRHDLLLTALLAYAASVPFMTVAVWEGLGHRLFLSELVFLACAAVALPVAIARRWWRRLGWLEVWAGLYLLAGAVSTLLSEEPAVSARKLVGISYLVAVGVIGHLALDAPWKRRRLVTVWLAAGAVTAAASVAGGLGFYLGLDRPAVNPFLRHYGSLPVGPYPRVGAFFPNVNLLCNYLIVVLALAWERWARHPRLWPYGLLLAAVGAAALFTLSTGIGGLLLVAGLLAARGGGGAPRRARFRRLAATAGLAGAVLVLLAATLAPLPGGELEPSLRVLTWRGALETLARHPLTGRGLGLAVTDVPYRVPDGRLIRFTDGHNVWLNYGAQAGLVGLLALAGLVAWSLRRGFGRVAAEPVGGPSPPVLALALVGALLYHGLTGSFEDARHLWLLLGLLAAAGEEARAG